jgi:hypothetical protein
MTVQELIPILQSLPKSDKLRIIQFLAGELVKEELSPFFEEGKAYPVWSPYQSFEAADALMKFLEAEKVSKNE